MLKKFITAPLILLLIATLIVPVFATDVQQVLGNRAGKACRIYPSDTSAESDAFGLYTDVEYYGENDTSSVRVLNLYVYSSLPGSSWVQAKKDPMAPGGTANNSLSLPTAASWKVRLNPYGVNTTGCSGFAQVTD